MARRLHRSLGMSRARAVARPGWVHLVGAGPGDPGLVTVKGRDLLETCDCVLYDRLVNVGVLQLASRDAEHVNVGKMGHGTQVSQEDIHRLLVDRARQGLAVVRLKGGCPTVFGRLPDEAAALRAARVPFEIVPGVSSALAVPASAGISVTHRGLASSLAIVAGHCVPSRARTLLRVAHADTIVVLMGASSLPQIVSEICAAGRSPDTPAAFISRGTLAEQLTLRATLSTLEAEVAGAGAHAPAVVVVGEVAAAAEDLTGWASCLSDSSSAPTS